MQQNTEQRRGAATASGGSSVRVPAKWAKPWRGVWPGSPAAQPQVSSLVISPFLELPPLTGKNAWCCDCIRTVSNVAGLGRGEQRRQFTPRLGCRKSGSSPPPPSQTLTNQPHLQIWAGGCWEMTGPPGNLGPEDVAPPRDVLDSQGCTDPPPMPPK